MDRYCTQTIKVPFKNRIFYNTETFVNLPKSGDAISRIRLVIDLDESGIGEEIINEAELITNKVSIEKLYGEFIKIENQFLVRNEMKDEYSRLLCVNAPGTAYIDIPFWTVKNMLFNFETLRILFSSSRQQNNKELNGYLLVDYVVVNKPHLGTETYFQNFRNIARLNVPYVSSVKKLTMDTYIPGSVFEIWVTIKDNSTGTYVQDDVLEKLTLMIGNDERFSVSSVHMRYIEPLKIYKSNAVDFPVYMYSFRLKYSSNLPSGQTNLTDAQRFVFDFVNNASSYNVTLWAQYHDFYYKNGEKGIRPMFDSGELVLGTSSILCSTFDQIPDFKTSYTFYSGTAAIQYSSSVEIQSVTITDTSCTSNVITQNEIIFGGLDSLEGTYYANVVFHSVGYSDITCQYNFKSPKSLFYNFNGDSIGFFDTFYAGTTPTFFVDGNQRINAFSGTYLNGTDYTKTITNVVADQYRNYIITFSDGTCSKSGVNAPVTGIPSTYFDTYVIPCANLFYINSTVHTVSNCNLYGSVCVSDGSVYVSGTTINSNPIVIDNSTVISNGSGTKSILYKYSSYCIVADNNSGPGLVSYNKNGPVFAFPVTSSTTLYCTDFNYTYGASGVSVAQILSSSGALSWRYTINGSSLTLLKCMTDYFDNVLFSYKNSTNFYITKLSQSGTLKWSRTFTPVLQKMDFVIAQDCTIVSYTAGSSNVLLTSDTRAINVPAGFTGVDVLDSDGTLVTFYNTPTSNVTDFTNKVKETYYTPLFSGEYFSNALDYNYTKTYRNLWGVFVNGTPSIDTVTTDINATNVIFTGQYGPASTNIFPSTSITVPSTNKSATFVSKINLSSGEPIWVTYIDNTISRYTQYSVNLTTTGNVYASGTYGKYQSNIYNADGSQFTGNLPSLGDNGVYLVKYDPDGQALWQTYINGVGGNETNYAIARKNSNTYIIGNGFSGASVTFYNATLTGSRVPVTSGLSTTNQTFIGNYDANGQVQWIMSVPYTQAAFITTELSGNVLCNFNYFSGGSSQVVQSNGTLFAPSFSNYSVLKFTPDGFGLLGFNVTSSGDARITSIASNSTDNSIYICGRLPNSNRVTDFYNWNAGTQSIIYSGTSINPTRNSETGDAYIAKYTSNGVYQWSAVIIHLDNSKGQVAPQSIVSDSVGNLYVCGFYDNYTSNAAAFNSDGTQFTGAVLPGVGFGAGFGDSYTGGFLVKYNSSGICQWITRFDTSSLIFRGSMSIAPDDTIIISGNSYGKNIKFYDSNGGEHYSFQPGTPSQTFSYCVRYDTNGFILQTNSHNLLTVSNFGDNSVNVYTINDSGAFSLTNRISGLSYSPRGGSVSADGSILSVSSNVYQKVGNVYSLTQTINDPGSGDTTMSTDGTTLAITNYSGSTANVYTINPNGTYSLSTTINGLNQPRSVSLTPNGSKLAVSNYLGGTANVYTINPNGTYSLSTTIGGFTNPTGIAINEDGNTLVVCDQNTAKVYKNSILNSTITGLSNPTDVDITSDGRLIAIANANGNTANLYQVTQGGTYVLLSTITGLKNPSGISLS